jgi:multidrug efflux pump subunit AcrA (membrane-fusion protein)
MAIITEKNTRRYRVQFTLSRALYQSYEASLEHARKLGVVIDFMRDFSKFFAAQLEQVTKELQQLETEQSQSEKTQRIVQTPGKSKATPSVQPVTDIIDMKGGADHGDNHQ